MLAGSSVTLSPSRLVRGPEPRECDAGPSQEPSKGADPGEGGRDGAGSRAHEPGPGRVTGRVARESGGVEVAMGGVTGATRG